MPRSGSQDPFPWLGPHRYGAREPCPRSAPVHARIDLDLPLFLWRQLLADADHAGYRVMTCLAQLARCRLGLLGPREPAVFPAIQVHPSTGAGERDRTADLPFTSWKRPSAKQQVGSLDSASELRKQAAEGYVWTSEGVHGGTILDHSWDQMGPALGPSSLSVREIEHVGEQAYLGADKLAPWLTENSATGFLRGHGNSRRVLRRRRR